MYLKLKNKYMINFDLKSKNFNFFSKNNYYYYTI